MLYPLELRALNDLRVVPGSFFTDFTPISESASVRRIAVVMSAVETMAYRRNTLAVL